MNDNFKNSRIVEGCCLEKMKNIPDRSIDLICADLPYGVTNNSKDIVIPFSPLWKEYDRILKVNGCVALYAQGLFYVDLVQSNRKHFRYDLVWDKKLTGGFLNSNKMPLRVHEQIAIFYRKLPTYNPQMTEGKPLHGKGNSYKDKKAKNQNYGEINITDDSRKGSTLKFPKSILSFQKPHPSKANHRTEKSVECNEWIVKTYSNEGDIVLDNTSGSGTLGEACVNTGRDFILIEKNHTDFKIGEDRILSLFNNLNIDSKHLYEELATIKK